MTKHRSVSDTYVWIDPARRSGEPCIGGTRVPVELVVRVMWVHGMAEVLGQFSVTRPQVLAACWYAGAGNVIRLHGKGGKYVAHRGPWRKRWGSWAAEMHSHMWNGLWDNVTDPPTTATTEAATTTTVATTTSATTTSETGTVSATVSATQTTEEGQ